MCAAQIATSRYCIAEAQSPHRSAPLTYSAYADGSAYCDSTDGKERGRSPIERPKSREETPKVGCDAGRRGRHVASLHMGLFGVHRNAGDVGVKYSQQICGVAATRRPTIIKTPSRALAWLDQGGLGAWHSGTRQRPPRR